MLINVSCINTLATIQHRTYWWTEVLPWYKSWEEQSKRIRQPAYTENLLKRQGMQDSKPISTPVEVGSKLQPATNEAKPVNQTEYQLGSLMYLSVSSRPDITFAVNNLAWFNSNPQKEHWTALKWVLRYLKGTTNIGILYKQDRSDKCIGYSDADWAGDTSERKSTSVCSVVDQFHGAAESKSVQHFLQQKLNMLFYLELPKSAYGWDNCN